MKRVVIVTRNAPQKRAVATVVATVVVLAVLLLASRSVSKQRSDFEECVENGGRVAYPESGVVGRLCLDLP